MSCPTGTYRLAEGVRLRPLPELRACLAYRRWPRPALITLNLTAWIVLSLCQEHEGPALEAAYKEALGKRSPDEATLARALERGLEQLSQSRLIEPAEPVILADSG